MKIEKIVRKIVLAICIIIPLIFCAWGFLLWSAMSYPYGENEIHILPSGFIGVVMIIYDQEDGEDKKMENGSILYRIPPSGILAVKSAIGREAKKINCYYEKDGKRTDIFLHAIFLYPDTILPPRESVFYYFGTKTYGKGDSLVDFKTYIACKENEIDSLRLFENKIHPIVFFRKK